MFHISPISNPQQALCADSIHALLQIVACRETECSFVVNDISAWLHVTHSLAFQDPTLLCCDGGRSCSSDDAVCVDKLESDAVASGILSNRSGGMDECGPGGVLILIDGSGDRAGRRRQALAR